MTCSVCMFAMYLIRWGDKGIGVGHFWDPSEQTSDRLPPPRGVLKSSEYFNGSTGQISDGCQLAPPWLEKRLQSNSHSVSHPDLAQLYHSSDPSIRNPASAHMQMVDPYQSSPRTDEER